MGCLEKLQLLEREGTESNDLVARRPRTGWREYETIRIEVLLEAEDIRIGFGEAKILGERLEGCVAIILCGIGRPGISRCLGDEGFVFCKERLKFGFERRGRLR